MKKAYEIAYRFREVILNGTWIANTNYKHTLLSVDWETATKKVGDVNTIALIAQHIHYYIKGVSAVLQGGELTIKDQYSFSFPPLESQAAWEQFLSHFWSDAETFASLVEQMPNTQLDVVFVDEKYGTYQQNIEAMIEHSYYHLGQIVLLKKLLDKHDQ